MSNKITADTMIPISIFGALGGGIVWLSIMFGNITHANDQISDLEQEIQAINKSRESYRGKLWQNQRSIDRRLSQIEGKLDFIVKTLKE